MKVLHIIQDEKFIETAYNRFEKALPGGNTFLLASIRKQEKYKHLKKVHPIVNCRFTDFYKADFIEWLASYDLIVLHSLTDFSIEVVKRVKSKTIIVWIGWGYDYYDMIYSNAADLYEKYTLQYILRNKKKSFKFTKQRLVKLLLNKLIFRTEKEDVLEYIDYFSPVLKSEYIQIKDRIENFPPRYIDWNYGSANKISDLNFENGKDIIIGNSASPNNNHVDAFLALERYKRELKGRVIVPLSYSGTPDYINYVMKMGYEIFGDKFYPMTDFVPYEEYVKIIKKSGAMLMNHKRQQGTGNIGVALLLGVKVFCHPMNAYYQTSLRRNMYIFSLEELNEKEALSPLTIEQKTSNQKNMLSILDENWFDKRTKNMLKIASDRSKGI